MMSFEMIILLICMGLLIISNSVIVITSIKKNKDSGIKMETEDYIVLIAKQIEQMAYDSLSLVSINKDDYDDTDDYTKALAAETKKILLEDAEQYGVNPKFVSLIEDSIIDVYVHDAVKNVVMSINRSGEGLEDLHPDNSEEGFGENFSLEEDAVEETDDSFDDEATEPAPESAYTNEKNILKALNTFYDDE